MTSHLPRNERKTCLGCARAKRTCDKQMPSCQRCALKKLDCQYPTTRRYYRAPPQPAQLDGVSAVNSFIPDVDDPQPQEVIRQDNPGNAVSIPTPKSASNVHATYKPWFLELETWTIESVGTSTCRFNPEPIRVSSGAKAWSTGLEDWLRQWVEQGYNPFIHQQLYFDTGLPQCLQDAWTTVTAYFSKTEMTEYIVMKIIEDRADALLRAQASDDTFFMAATGLETIDQLARVQALLIYQFIRLYDGSIRQRALAENCFQTVLLWCQQLWQSATLSACHEIQLENNNGLRSFDPKDDETTLRHWKAWILSESVRRTWLVCHSTMAVYFRERDGWNSCTGEIRFTASAGLWDAPSSTAWAKLASEKDLLFVQSLHVDELLSSAAPAEVDIFSKVFMKLLLGKEKVDDWTGKRLRTVETSETL